MDPILAPLIAGIVSQAGVAILVLLFMVVLLYWALREERAGAREDRKASIEVQAKLAEALQNLRVDLAAIRGSDR